MIKGALKLIRPLNVAITMAAVYAAGIISAAALYSRGILMAVIASGFIAAFGNIVNDIFDLQLDRKAKRFRPLPSGEINVISARLLAVLCAILALILSTSIDNFCLLIASLALIALLIYTPYFKGSAYWGNLLVALVSALAFFYGAAAAGNPAGGAIPALFAFLFHFIREIVKDMEDYTHDREFSIVTGAVKYGLKTSARLAVAFTVILIMATLIPPLIGLYRIGYLIVVLLSIDIPLIYIAKRLLSSPDRNTCRFLSGLMKAMMPLGLLAIYLGSRGI